MNNAELADKIAEAHDLPKSKAKEILATVLDEIQAAVAAGSDVSLNGFGKFAAKDTPAREGRNPATGATIQIAAGRKVAFTVAKAFKDKVSA